VELSDGRRLTKFVEQSLGNIHRPLTDKQLDEKFRDQALLVLPSREVESVIQQCWDIDALDDVGELVRTTVPGGAAVERQVVS